MIKWPLPEYPLADISRKGANDGPTEISLFPVLPTVWQSIENPDFFDLPSDSINFLSF